MPRKPKHGGAREGAGAPETTGMASTPPVHYRVSAEQRAELSAEGRRHVPRLTPSAAAKYRAFPSSLILVCTDCGLTGFFDREGNLLPTEVAAAKGWWQLGDGKRGRCSDCEAKPRRAFDGRSQRGRR